MHLRTVSRFSLIMLVTLVLGLGCSFPYRPKLNWFTRPTSTLTLTATPSITPSATPTSTLTPTSTFTATLSPTPTSTGTLTPTATKVLTATKTLSPTPAPTYPSSTPTKPIYGVPGKAQLISPSGLIPQKKPVYTWSEVSDATVYYLLVYPVDEPSIYLIDTWYLSGQVCTDSTCAIRSDLRLGYGTYNWLVQTWNAAGFGPWSDAKKFIVSPATPTRTPTITRTPTSTRTRTSTPTPSSTATHTRTPTPTATAVQTLVVEGSKNGIGTTQSIAISGSYAYMGQGNNLIVLDISIPAAPSTIGVPLNLSSHVRDIDIPASGNYAYIATDSGLKIINISVPAAPVYVGSDISVKTYGIAVAGTTAYLAQYSSGFRVVDVSNPALPVGLGSFAMANAYDVAVSVAGPYVYVANGVDGLFVMNVVTPGTITKLGQYNSPGNAVDVATTSDYAYIADGNKGLRVVKVTTPTSPTSVGSFEFSADAIAVDINSIVPYHYIYVAAGSSGIWIFKFDEANPTNPIAVGYYNTTPGIAYDIDVVGFDVFVADGPEGLIILQFP